MESVFAVLLIPVPQTMDEPCKHPVSAACVSEVSLRLPEDRESQVLVVVAVLEQVGTASAYVCRQRSTYSRSS